MVTSRHVLARVWSTVRDVVKDRGRALTPGRRRGAENEARFRMIFQDAPVGMALAGLDPDDPGRYLMVNRTFCELTGYPPEQLLGMSFRELTHPDDRDEDAAQARQLVQGERDRYSREKRLVRADGSVIWVRMSASPAVAVDGRRYVIGHVEDITGRVLAERAARETLTALQSALLPGAVHAPPEVALAARYRSAGSGHDQLGGDWYDSIPLPDGGLALVIGDVEGHDLTAATVMGLVRGAVRTAALEGHPPASVTQRVNSFLFSSGIDRLVTMAYVQLYPGNRTATVTLAGHLEPLMVSADARVSTMSVSYGVALNVDPEASWQERTVLLPDGASLVLYTDGLIETPRGHDHGRVLAAAEAAKGRSVDQLADALIAAAPDLDDVALLVTRLSTRQLPPMARVLPALPSSAGVSRGWLEDLLTIWTDQGVVDKNVDGATEIVKLLATELVSNAVRHSDSVIRIDLDLVDDDALRLGVWDSSDRMPVLRPPDATATEGRGLRLVQTLSRRWGVELAAHGKVVWFEVDLDGATDLSAPL